MPLRPEFIEALRLVAEAAEEVVARGLSRPTLVGGAAVELYTGSTFVTGDFDFVAEAQVEFEAALLRRGFEKQSGPGVLVRGLWHRTLAMGVEVVGSQLMDGAADEGRVLLMRVRDAALAVAPVEELIADRVARYESGAGGHEEMLEQARMMYEMGRGIDETYLERRIGEETGGRLHIDILRRQ